MQQNTENLKQLGFDPWFEANSGTKIREEHEVARVISVHKESYVITKGGVDVFAELLGKLLYTADSPVDLPTVGDWVYADFCDDNSHAIIHGLLPRKTLIKRKTSGKNIEFQLIGANIDVAFIVQSLDNNFNLNRLERYLVMVNDSQITPVVLLSKCDLMEESEVAEKVGLILNIMPETQVVPFSNENGANMEAIRNLFIPGQTTCLLGSSGVGKTTLLNHLVTGSNFETQPVREKDSRGRHTTTHRQLIRLASGAMLIDTPGMRELGNMSVDAGIDETFVELTELSKQCKYADCNHVNEAGCAVLEAIDQGVVPKSRVQNFLAMKRESDYNEMSYLEKKQKDKKFGQMIKSVLKNKANKEKGFS